MKICKDCKHCRPTEYDVEKRSWRDLTDMPHLWRCARPEIDLVTGSLGERSEPCVVERQYGRAIGCGSEGLFFEAKNAKWVEVDFKFPEMPEQHRPEPQGPSSNEGRGANTEMQATPAGADNVTAPSSNPRTP